MPRNTAVLVKRVPLQRREAIIGQSAGGGETDLDANGEASAAEGDGGRAAVRLARLAR